MANHKKVVLKPRSDYPHILNILWEENFISGFSLTKQGKFKVVLNYFRGAPAIKKLLLISKVNQPCFISFYDLVYLKDHTGIFILSTNKGLITNQRAQHLGIGGKLIAYIE
uniref:ribosomal protein S8 n=1 Tax=Ishige okamurae TaxID=233772 RepID=UPI002E7A6090|nr:ribosomal protein S8 [Ishige okamurae]WBP70187.1 ribosomal protein S8 [Ishige okamurae]